LLVLMMLLLLLLLLQLMQLLLNTKGHGEQYNLLESTTHGCAEASGSGLLLFFAPPRSASTCPSEPTSVSSARSS
jgi:hypothetical protein